MKRIKAIFFLLTFLIANTGMAFTVHYCGGKLSSINFFPSGDNESTCEKGLIKSQCCKDKTVHLSANKNLTKASRLKINAPILKIISCLIKQTEIIPAKENNCFHLFFPDPQRFRPKSPIYLLNRVIIV